MGLQNVMMRGTPQSTVLTFKNLSEIVRKLIVSFLTKRYEVFIKIKYPVSFTNPGLYYMQFLIHPSYL